MRRNKEMKIQELFTNKKVVISIAVVVVILIASIIGLVVLLNNKQPDAPVVADPQPNVEEPEPEPQEKGFVQKEVGIVGINSNERVFGFVLDNAEGAYPQTGMSKAFLTYEFIVEGGITRYVSFFQHPDLAKIGPLRSARHYFLDYAMENSAVFVHFGWSPRAQSDISSLGVNSINGNIISGGYFYRANDYYAPHNAFTSYLKAKQYATDTNISVKTVTNNFVLKYNKEPIDFSKEANAIVAGYAKITYSDYFVKYEYDSENKVYKRFRMNQKDTDKATKQQITVKNIISIAVKNKDLTGQGAGKGRQDLENIGEGTGYYISEGKAIAIKWYKKDRKSKTEYKKLDGTDLIVNDGNTYIQMHPIDEPVEIS